MTRLSSFDTKVSIVFSQNSVENREKIVRKFLIKGLILTLASIAFFGGGRFLFFASQPSSVVLPTAFPILKKEGYTLCYDGRNRIPLWVFETLSKESLKGEVSRKRGFFQIDKEVYEHHRSGLEDYKGSGFDRGHLAPAANHTFSKNALKESFLLSNMAPMNPEFNRGVWSQLESYARKWTLEYECVYVISGPLFLPEKQGGTKEMRYSLIGNNQVAVPTHFFKVIIGKKGAQYVTEAYVLPNKGLPKQASFRQFLSSTEEIEKSSGIEFPLYQ